MNEPVPNDGAEHVRDLLSDYLNDDLADAQRVNVQRHLTTCARCRRDFDSLRLTVQLVRQVPLRPVPRSFAIAAPSPRRSWSLFWLRVSTSTLAALFVAVLALRLVLPSASLPTAPGAGSPAETPMRAMASAAAPTQPAAAAPMRAVAAVQAATPAPADHPLAGAAAAPVASDSAGVAPRHAAGSQAAAATAAPAQAPAARQAEKAAASTASEARATTAPAAAPAPPPRPIARPTEAPRPLPVPTLPAWYTPLLIAVGALFATSLASLVWVSFRR